MAEWYTDMKRLTEFGQVLIAAGVLEDTADMRVFFKQPYKYNDLYAAWKDNGYPQEEDEEWDDFIAQIDTGEEVEEEESETDEEETEE